MYEYTNIFVFMIILSVCINDSFALFAGMKFGKKKLNPRISPNKTIAGSIGGYAGGCATVLLIGLICLKQINSAYIITLALTLPVVTQIGDLAFSAIKRHYGIKDFSNLFPGHGGVLDRLDSISFSCMWAYALMVVML